MNFLTRHLTRLVFPFLLRVDFRSELWQSGALEARAWLLTSVFLSLLAQAMVGQLSPLNALITLLSPLGVWWTANRMVLGVGYLQVAGSIGSLLLVLSLLLLGVPAQVVQAIAMVWQVWGLVALVVMFLRHMRTPKSL